MFFNVLLSPFYLAWGVLEFLTYPIKQIYKSFKWVIVNRKNLVAFVKSFYCDLGIRWEASCVEVEVNKIEQDMQMPVINFNGWVKDAHGRWVKK